jgi:hypothetical protein
MQFVSGQLIDATPQQSSDEELLSFLDTAFSDLLTVRTQGEYVKISDVTDIILDIRQKLKHRSTR